MDNRYITGQVQVNISNDNSTLNATQTQIINYIESKKIPKMMTPNPIAIKNRVSGTVNKLCGNIGVRPQCGQPSVNLRQVSGQSNGQWCEIGKRGK